MAEAVKHAKALRSEIIELQKMDDMELDHYCKQAGVTKETAMEVISLGRLPVVTFAAGGIATPADAALLMQLGMDGVFVGSGIFKSENPENRAKAIVQAVSHFNSPEIIAKASYGLGIEMKGTVVKN